MAGGTTTGGRLTAPTRNRPPQQPQQSTFNHPPLRQAPLPASTNFLRAIAITLLALILLTGLIVLITWLAIHPRKLEYKLHSASITNYNLTSTPISLNSTFHFTLHAYNPNTKVTVLYDKLKLTVSYNGNDLASTRIGTPIVQGHRNVTRMKVEAVATNAELSGSDVWMLKRDRTGGSVDLDVVLKGKIRFKVGKWKSGKYKLKVLCSPVVIFSDAKRFQPTQCDVDI